MDTHHTATWGWVAVGVGAAAIASGAYWYFRSRPSSGATGPAIGFLPGPGGGLLALVGRF